MLQLKRSELFSIKYPFSEVVMKHTINASEKRRFSCFAHTFLFSGARSGNPVLLKRTLSFAIASFLFVSVGASSAFAGNSRTQTFEIEKGWNAIYLAVEPAEPYPSLVFTNYPIDIVAGYESVLSTQQFSSDPTADMLSDLGWGVWYSPSRPDSFLTDLASIHGGKAYLVHAVSAFTLAIEGAVEMVTIRWQPNAFNFTGFCLDPVAPPSI
jgi:hypothetical protein